MKMKLLVVFFTLIFCGVHQLNSQSYAPAAGIPGSTAIHMDSSVFKSWAKSCEVTRGYMDISNPNLGKASAGQDVFGTGKALSNGVVSLGDGGFAILQFDFLISNGPGYDFAVFENSFDGKFLELAFVEVSSDGINFFRFPSHSLTDTVLQTPSYATTDPTKINNLAGKYANTFGTPFDLEELKNINGLNINAISHVKIIDVVGSINPQYASRDSYNNIINDPWPTDFAPGGFDLDAVGVIHHGAPTTISKISNKNEVRIYPNPLSTGSILHLENFLDLYHLYDVNGILVISGNGTSINIGNLKSGFYVLTLFFQDAIIKRKITIL